MNGGITCPEALVERCIKAGTSQHGCCSKCGAPWERVMGIIGNQVTDAMKVAGCDQMGNYGGNSTKSYDDAMAQNPSDTKRRILESMSQIKQTLGWRPTCTCYGVELIGDQPIKPRKDKVEVDNRIESFVQDVEPEVKETDAEFKARIKDYESEIKIWTEKWAMLKPIYDKLESIPCTVLDPFVGSGTVCLVSMNLRRLSIGIDLNPDYIEMAEKRCGIDAPSLFAFGGADADKHPSGR